MSEYQGYLENGRFEPIGRSPGPERRKVHLHIVEEPAAEINCSYAFERLSGEEGAEQLAAVEEFLAAIRSTPDEMIPMFERANLFREVQI